MIELSAHEEPLQPSSFATRTLVLTLLACFIDLLGCRPGPVPSSPPVVLFLGDSITFGITHGHRGEVPATRDPLGGYPGRLQRCLGPDVRVVNRGIPGATARWWLQKPREPQKLLRLFSIWSDFHPISPPTNASSIALGVLQTESPDIGIVFLGANDLGMERSRGEAFVDTIMQRLQTLRGQAASVSPNVLVATVLPNLRRSEGTRPQLNARIQATFPDYLPLAKRFADAGWKKLLGDRVHPNEAGYEVLARILADELTSRGLVPQKVSARWQAIKGNGACADPRNE